MKIMFTRDFRGPWTKELFYTAGTIYEIDDDGGAELIARGHAVALEQPAASPVDEPKPDRKQRGKHGHSAD
jgi:hypothetical protein